MTSPTSFAVIAVLTLFVHVALSTELLLEPRHQMPALVRWFVHVPPPRTMAFRVMTLPVLVGLQIFVGLAVVQPERVAGATGVLIAGGELAAALLWLFCLGRWRRSPP